MWKMLINSYSCQNYSQLFFILLYNLVTVNKNTSTFSMVKCLNKIAFFLTEVRSLTLKPVLLFHNRILISLIHDFLLQRSRRNNICGFYTWELFLHSAVVDSNYIVY